MLLTLILSITLGNAAHFVFFLILGLVAASPLLIKRYSTELGVTNKRMIGKRGLIHTQALDSPLNKINNVSVSSGLFGKLTRYGRVRVATSSGAYNSSPICDPEQFRVVLPTQIDALDVDQTGNTFLPVPQFSSHKLQNGKKSLEQSRH